MNKYTLAAYIATWVIHIGYVALLSGRAARLRREWEEFRRSR